MATLARDGTGIRSSLSRFSNASSAATMPAPWSEEPEDLEAKATQKLQFIQDMLRNLEKAVRNSHQPEEQRYLQRFVDPRDRCFRTLVNLLISPKYADFAGLRCVTLRAVQMILKIGQTPLMSIEDKGRQRQIVDPNIGMQVMQQLLGENTAAKALREFANMASKTEQALVACDAMLVLAELGPQAFGPHLVPKLLELFAALPDRAPDLVEVALRVHAWGGEVRAELLQAAVTYEGGRYMGEVLLQVVNRGDKVRQLRSAKIFSGCFSLPNGKSFLFSNDRRVLVEILLRELANHARNAADFICFAECYQALISQCEAARQHQQAEAVQLFEDLGEDQCPQMVSERCTEVLAMLKRQ